MLRKLFFASPLALCLFSGCSKDIQPPAEKFIGTYAVTESCGSGNGNYKISISYANESRDKVIIDNFGDYGTKITASVDNDNLQFTSVSGNLVISGSAAINDARNQINFVYSVSAANNPNTDNCGAIAIK